MLRSMYSAITGMLNHQIRMDVIGNDIANVNTVSYKEKRTSFSEAFSQTSRFATQSYPVGLSVGLGSSVVGTQTAFTQGAFQRTNVVTDLGVAGDGFFRVQSRVNKATNVPDTVDGTSFFTRAGNFVIDNENFLRTADGNFVLGFDATDVAVGAPAGLTYALDSASTPNANNTRRTVDPVTVNADPALFTDANLTAIRLPRFIDPDNPVNIDGDEQRVSSFSIGSDGKIVVVGDGGLLSTVGFVAIALFDNNDGLTVKQNSYYQNTDASGLPRYLPGGTGGIGTVQSGVLELSNVDLATEFSDMIATQRGFEANARTISVSDEMLQTAVNLKR